MLALADGVLWSHPVSPSSPGSKASWSQPWSRETVAIAAAAASAG